MNTETRLQALNIAKEWGAGGSLEEIIRAAAIIEVYLTFGSNFSNVIFGKGVGITLRASRAVNNVTGCGVEFNDVVAGEGLVLGHLDPCGDAVDKPLSAAVSHKHNPSQKENNCGQELPTPGHTETVVPGGGAVTEPGTHGRTDGGVRQ